jgi:hypothetical protein
MALGLAGGLLGATPAIAADEPTAQAGRFWLFEHDNRGGGQDGFWGTDKDLRNNYWDGSARISNNNASSMDNNTDRYIVLANTPVSCGGATYLAKPNSSDNDFTNNDFDNKASCVIFQ